MRIVIQVFLVVAVIGATAGGKDPGNDAPPEKAAGELVLNKHVAKRLVEGEVVKLIVQFGAKAISFFTSKQEKAKTDMENRKLTLSLEEIREYIANLPNVMEKIAVEMNFQNKVAGHVKNLVQLLGKIADPNLKRYQETQIGNFMEKLEELNLVFLMMDMEDLLMTPATNLLILNMNQDDFHRKSTLEDIQQKIDSMMKVIIFSHAVRVSILGNSTTIIKFIEEGWNKDNLSDNLITTAENFTLADSVHLKENTKEPEKKQNFPTLMEYYVSIHNIMKEQIAKQFHERSFEKMSRLVNSTMRIVERENIGKKEMVNKKVAQLKSNLDSMYTNDRYFVIAYDGATIEQDVLNSSKEDFYNDGKSIVVFRAEPVTKATEKIWKPNGNALRVRDGCATGKPSKEAHDGSLAVIYVWDGIHEIATDMNYTKIYDDPRACKGIPPWRHTKFGAGPLTSYIIFG